MPTLESILEELKSKGSEKTRIIYARHGMPIDRMFGVSVADEKIIAKTIKGQQALALELYASGNFDAMYLAGMVADGAKMTRAELESWAEGAKGMPMIYEHTVAWVTVEHPEAHELARQWIQSDQEHIASAGWATYMGLLATKPDSNLDLDEIGSMLDIIANTIHTADNRVKSKMNSFVISVGSYVKPLSEKAKAVAQQIGAVSVDVGNTACKVPLATEYIAKVESANKVGQKRKTIRC